MPMLCFQKNYSLIVRRKINIVINNVAPAMTEMLVEV